MKGLPLIKLQTLLIVILLGFSFSGCSQVKWVEGTHYKTVSGAETQADDGQKNIKEYFSFWCPHCYQAEPLMKQLSKDLPEDIAFTKIHVNFMGFVPKSAQNIATLSLAAARANGTEKEFADALFKAIHINKEKLLSMTDFADVFAASSGNDKTLKAMASEFSVRSMEKANNKAVDDARLYLTGVPSLVVNDKYLLILSSGLNPQEINELIVWLSAR